MLARAAQAAGIEPDDLEPIAEDDPEPSDQWVDLRLQEAPARWGRDRGAANCFGQLSTDPFAHGEAEPPRKVKRKHLNETGVPLVIPEAQTAATFDPRSGELGDPPVLELLGDEWEHKSPTPKSAVVVSQEDKYEKLEEKLESVQQELKSAWAELKTVAGELQAVRAEVAATRAELKTSNAERKLMRETLQGLVKLLPPGGISNFPVVDDHGKQVSVVAIEQVPGVEQEELDYEE